VETNKLCRVNVRYKKEISVPVFHSFTTVVRNAFRRLPPDYPSEDTVDFRMAKFAESLMRQRQLRDQETRSRY
jgi:hypothetical protein